MDLQKAKQVFRRNGGFLRASEALSAGISPRTLYQMRIQGVISQISRGLFRLSDFPFPDNLDLIAVTLRVPNSVISLISALSFYQLTTEIPHFVYIALQGPGTAKTATPKLDFPPLRAFRFSGHSFSQGIALHNFGGVSVKIYDPSKTIADCFKFPYKLGLDVAIEALKLYRYSPFFNTNLLHHYSKICRVDKVISPFLQVLL